LARHYPRTLSNNLTCQFQSTLLQVEGRASRVLRGAKVTVLKHFDGTAELCWRNASLPFTAVERPRRAPVELTRQEVTWPRKWRSISTPRANHPWKTTPIGPRSPEYVNRGSINDLGPDISTLLTPDIFYFARNRTFLLCLDMQRVTACHGNVDGVEFA